ncbi:hypothetical protein SPRG_17025 [Saprolegnia parasitica CBS 223.65]|uniref:Uncharacterized protein n=1 Tax=Saprolegnia parasitica (strain CBS 223.65) TaxID=695850 RepID=A0A067BGN3_SAPPC|nr:hypothetical protein SPRG_17025 [Saprolegnia parasitica CBS 223.65]KDO17559.1 hypothetical protein SPRG_17025 [Saprolegnia parasitica CBS 223.65]|eukprot:XP_012211735.1 hypothetical protein SPRG_17025 [Saprolegnia parasitica CBS 223.65]
MATHHFNTMEANKKQGAARRVDAYPTLPVLKRTATVIELYEALYPDAPMPLHARARRVVSRLAALSLPWEDLPIGVALPLKYAVYMTTHFPDAALCPNECRLVNRADLLAEHEVPPCALPLIDKDSLDASRDNDDGFTDVVLASQPLFPKDQRLKEVCRLLRSNKPMLLKVQREAHHSDADVLSLQQARLLLLCKRSMSLSVARGMVTLGSLTAQQSSASPYTARLSIPQLPLTARVSGTNAKTVLDISGYKEITHWPQFHNGVATALRLSPHDRVTVQWVLSHQPKPNADESDEAVRLYEEACAGHAGFLFGLGLQGQLQCQSPTTTYKYLSLGDELTSVGFLLGTAASTLHHPKDMNIERAVSKMLSMHIPSLWPPSFAHLHVPASAQTAAIMGLGLLYQSTGNRLMTEFLLTEMTQGPVLTSAGASSGTTATPSTEAVQFEGYALATGFALGLILLGRENDPGLVDLNLDAKLTKYMLGGEKERGHGSWAPTELNCVLRTRKLLQRELINVDVTASGSALALAFMYMWSNSASIGQRLHVPSTLVLLETIRPDVLFVRALAANLVLWSSIEPTRAWVINKQLPPPLRPTGLLHWAAIDDGGDPATIQEAYANVIAGACFSIGLKFAGTHHPDAKSVLMSFLDEFQLWRAKLGRTADVSRVTLERVLGTIAQSLALVMAGTGDLECMRLLRSLLLRQKVDAHGDITYGNHMAMSSALGLLFLGGGRCSVRSSRLATATLVIALYPLYPTKTTDQRYHLQAFRHLYVLAIDRSRLVRALDVDTHQWTPMPLRVWTHFSSAPLEVRTPTLLPARSMLRRLETAANDHFPIVVDWSTADDSRARLLEQQGVLRIKRKLGADAPRATFFASFSNLFATVLTQASDTMWIAFCARLYEECKRENKPDCVAVYLNAKRCEVDVLEHRITHTLLVANLQLVQLHMELDAHMFQARDDASAEPHDVGRLAQLVNEDFTLGYSNALLAFFEQLELPISIETNEAPASLLHAAYRRYLGSPLLAQLE